MTYAATQKHIMCQYVKVRTKTTAEHTLYVFICLAYFNRHNNFQIHYFPKKYMILFFFTHKHSFIEFMYYVSIDFSLTGLHKCLCNPIGEFRLFQKVQEWWNLLIL